MEEIMSEEIPEPRSGSGPVDVVPARLPRATYTVVEVADLLGVCRATAYELLRRGEIPARRVGSRWVIARRRFDLWLDAAGTEWEMAN
jgi:excisionase family DNA binding protein